MSETQQPNAADVQEWFLVNYKPSYVVEEGGDEGIPLHRRVVGPIVEFTVTLFIDRPTAGYRRVYPLSVWNKIMDAQDDPARVLGVVGEDGYGDHGIELQQVGFKLTDFEINYAAEGGRPKIKLIFETLDTPQGRVLAEMIFALRGAPRSGLHLGWCGLGTCGDEQPDGTLIVNDDYEFACWQIVNQGLSVPGQPT